MSSKNMFAFDLEFSFAWDWVWVFLISVFEYWENVLYEINKPVLGTTLSDSRERNRHLAIFSYDIPANMPQ